MWEERRKKEDREVQGLVKREKEECGKRGGKRRIGRYNECGSEIL